MICSNPRCNEPSVGDTTARFWPQCIVHAVEYADAQLARSTAERDSLRPYERGQMALLGSGLGAA